MTIKKITLPDLTFLVAGNMIGAGVFMLPASLAAYGLYSLWGWIVASIGALLLSFVFMNLSRMCGETGGPLAFVRKAFGDDAAFFTAWTYWILAWLGNAAVTVSLVGYLSVLTGPISKTWSFIVQAICIISFTGISMRGVQTSAKLNTVLTVLKLIPLIVVPFVGLFMMDMNNFTTITPTITGTPTGLVNTVAFICLWAFLGLETGTVPAEHVDNPKRTVPLATLLGTTLAVIVYILGTVALFGMIPQGELITSTAPFALAATKAYGGNWGPVIALFTVIACLGVLNGWFVVTANVAKGAADDGLMPKMLARTNAAQVPTTALIISSMLSLAFVAVSLNDNLTKQFDLLTQLCVVLVLYVYIACTLAYIKLNWQRQSVITTLGLGLSTVGFCAWALTAAGAEQVLWSLGLVATTLPYYFWWRQARSKLEIGASSEA